LKLLELERVDEAITASQELSTTGAIFIVAQRLRDAGRLDAALALAERGLALKGDRITNWQPGWRPWKKRRAGRIWRWRLIVQHLTAQPVIDLYRHIKRLSGVDWSNIRPALVQKAGASYSPGVLVDILLDEKDWDAAHRNCRKTNLDTTTARKSGRCGSSPTGRIGLIRIAIKQSNSLIEKTHSNLYPGAAAGWKKAKKAYEKKGQVDDWQAYISHLRTTYARRPALAESDCRFVD